MDLPIGFYPFSFEFLETLDPSTRRKYLSGLEKLWLQFFDIHTQHLSDYEKENYNFKQALHLRFLTQLTEFYNKQLPSLENKTELFPTFEREPDASFDEPNTRSFVAFNALISATTENESVGNGRNRRATRRRPSVISGYGTQRESLEVTDTSPEYSTSPPRKKRKLQYTEEKRLSRYRSTPSKALLERLEDTVNGRFLLVEEKRKNDGRIVNDCLVDRYYRVWDRTGKIYNVVIGNLPSCNCPASSKGLNCVHILFIFAKLLKVKSDEPILFQRALLTNELIYIYSQKPKAYPFTCTLCYDTIEDSVLSVTCTCNNTYHRDCVKILNQIPESQLATTVVCRDCRKPKLIESN